uniref:Uncharacterized protein n=1 Tax=Romanomermis culicivorax TaxID=13658 RepID=A0A915ILN0_ROMCU
MLNVGGKLPSEEFTLRCELDRQVHHPSQWNLKEYCEYHSSAAARSILCLIKKVQWFKRYVIVNLKKREIFRVQKRGKMKISNERLAIMLPKIQIFHHFFQLILLVDHVTLGRTDQHVTWCSLEKGRPRPCGGRGSCGMSIVVDCPRGATVGGRRSNGFLVPSGSWSYVLTGRFDKVKQIDRTMHNG